MVHGKHWLHCLLAAVWLAVLLCSESAGQEKLAIELVPQVGHSVEAVAFSPDGSQLVSGSLDTTLKLWDVKSGALLRTFEGRSAGIRSVAFSPDGSRVVSGGRDKAIKMWDVRTGALLGRFEGHTNEVGSVAFSPNGQGVLSGGWDYTMKLWDANTGVLTHSFDGHSGFIESVAFSPDSSRVLSGSLDNMVKVWDAHTGALLRVFQRHVSGGRSKGVGSAAFSPDGKNVLAGSTDGAISLWSVATGESLLAFKAHSNWVSSVAFSPDGKRVLSGSRDNSLKLWDARTGKLVRNFQRHTHWIRSAAFSPDGTHVLSSSHSQLNLWDTDTGKLARTFEGHSEQNQSVAFSPDGKTVFSGGSGPLKLWHLATGALVRTFEGNSVGISRVAFSPDGTHVVAGGGDKAIKLWNANTGTLVRTFQGHVRSVSAVAFSRDGLRLVSGGAERSLKIWNVSTGALLTTIFTRYSDGVVSVSFSADGTRLISGSSNYQAEMWDVESGALVRTFQARLAIFSPDGTQVLVTREDNRLELRNATTGTLERSFMGHSDFVVDATFSPDGSLVLSGGADRTLKLWNADTGALVQTFEGHSASVSSVSFSPDSRRIASASSDTTVRIWDAASGEQFAAMGGRGREWLTMTPAGFFSASSKGVRMLSVVRGLELTTIEQIHQSLFNPDLVREALAGDLNKEVRDAAKAINIDVVLESGPAPEITFTSHRESNQTSTELAKIGILVMDKGKGVGRIEWRVNGITAKVSTVIASKGPAHYSTEEIALDPGANTVEVVAYNGSNLLASLPARMTITLAGQRDVVKPKLHILAIGINKYIDQGWTAPGETTPSSFPPLNLAAKDADSFGVDMKKGAGSLYGDVKVTYAIDESATRTKLRDLVGKLANEIHPRDTFVLFAAAHGFSVDGRFYLIPQDYQGGSNPDALERNAIGQETLQDWLANHIRAKKAIVLLDTCESGALVAGHLRSRVTSSSEAAVGRLHEATGRPVLTAAAQGRSAYEGVVAKSGETHGFFTWAVLDALRNGDSNNNGIIELTELVAHVQDMVPKLAASLGDVGFTIKGIRGSTAAELQSARFGSRGEDFAVVKRLPPHPR